MSTVERLHRDAVIVEGHRDCYEQVHRSNLGHPDPVGDLLVPRLRTGGVDVVLYAVGGDSIAHSNGRDDRLLATLDTVSALLASVRSSDGRARTVHEAPDLPDRSDGSVSFVMHLEGGGPLEGSLAALETLYRVGVRSMQPTWNLRNQLADGVRESGTGGGLSRFGVAVLREMRQLGMLVDLAHISPAGFWHALRVTDAPLVVSHANASAVHDHPRNLTDDQVRAVAERGGVVGVHALPVFVDESRPTVDRLVDHVSYLAELAGIEHVGVGADFVKNDGPRSPREEIPARSVEALEGLEEIDELPNLTSCLLRRGFSETDITAILGDNFLRVLHRTLPGRSSRQELP